MQKINLRDPDYLELREQVGLGNIKVNRMTIMKVDNTSEYFHENIDNIFSRFKIDSRSISQKKNKSISLDNSIEIK